jgi:hypothetical protein
VNSSNGFLFSSSRVTSLRTRFKETVSRMRRFSSIFEPRQISGIFCENSKTAGQGHIDLRLRATALPTQDILTSLECRPVDQRSMSPFGEVAATLDLTDVDPVVEHVRDGRSMELRVRLLVSEALVGQLLADRFERMLS